MKKQQPTFSIITVCRNNLQGLKATYESIKNQKFDGAEWIVIDGDSKDGTVEYLNNLDFKKTVLSEPDHGIYDAMNKGIKFVNGKYVVYMNSGDTFFDSMSLELANRLLEEETVPPDLMLFGYTLKLPNASLVNKSPRNLSDYIWHGMPTSHQSIFFSREVIEENPYDCSYKICGDYYLLAKIFTKNYRSICRNQPTAIFEVGGTSFSNPWLLMFEAYKIKRNILKQGYLLNVLSFIKSLISIFGLRLLSLIKH